MRPGDYASAPVPAGEHVYLAVTRDRVCLLLAFDIASGRRVASLSIDRMRPELPGREEGSPPVRMLRRGTYLYLASPSYLTAIDIADPGRPVVTSQLQVRPRVSFLYGFPRPLAWQDNRLFEIRVFPETLAAYDLGDPARPVAQADLTYHNSMAIFGSGDNLYRPWRSGVLEFRAERDGLEPLRYLRGDRAVSVAAPAGDYVYALTAADSTRVRRVQTFKAKTKKGSK
jgi:hypothetical protein